MSIIYLILGIAGWTTTAIVIALYVWRGKSDSTSIAARSDSSSVAPDFRS